MSEQVTKCLSFLDQSPTSFHAISSIAEQLTSCGFSKIQETEKWNLEKGGKYFVSRGGSLCAFILPTKKIERATLLASHTDSPCLKLKPCSLFTSHNYLQLATEVYGAPLLSSWLNRDLKIAGRAFVKTKDGKCEERLVHLQEPLVSIPQLAIHLDREANDKGCVLNRQDHLNALVGLNKLPHLEELLIPHLDCKSILAYDLFLVPTEKAALLGIDREMISSYRLDNLLSAHAMLSSLTKAKSSLEETVSIGFFFDHEEIGSSSREGASSCFAKDVFNRLSHTFSLSLEESAILRAKSLAISIDLAHALHPSYESRHDPRNTPLFGKGVVFKSNANHRYASDAASSCKLLSLCKAHDLPYQFYAARGDIPCGSTVGPMIAESLGIRTVDIGSTLLSMHSVRELGSVRDYLDLTALLTHLLCEDA